MKRRTLTQKYRNTLKEVLVDTNAIQKLWGDTPPDIPDSVDKWLAGLKRLQDIPFQYLVPNDLMLPPESIKFFQIDWNWINCLIDGAYSIGRATESDFAHDQAFYEHVQQSTDRRVQKLRQQKLKITPSLNDAEPLKQVSGFLLRSGVVPGWPGMEVVGYSQQNADTPLTLLRFETLSPTVMICLFIGLVDKVILREAPEGIHFGVDIPDKGNPNDPKLYFKELKYIKDMDGHQAGDTIEGVSVAAPLPFRNQGKNVLQISTLANTIQSTLIQNSIITSSDPFTSAEFGLEMVEGVQEVIFESK